jgi:hypothetical protein
MGDSYSDLVCGCGCVVRMFFRRLDRGSDFTVTYSLNSLITSAASRDGGEGPPMRRPRRTGETIGEAEAYAGTDLRRVKKSHRS